MLTPYVGEVVLYAFNFPPQNWAPCAGQLLPLSQNFPLFSVIRNQFGGDGVSTFALPDYRKLAPQGMQYCIALKGVDPKGAPRPCNIGEIALLPYATPATWLNCNGQSLQVAQYQTLFQIIGTSFGGGGSSFRVPNLTMLTPPFPSPSAPIVQGQPGTAGGKVNRPAPTQSLYCISTSGAISVSNGAIVPAPPFLCEVRLLPSWSTPAGWSACKGQLMPINVNQALFSLLGFTFGGDGRTKFALPNLSKTPVPTGLQYCISVAGTFPTR
jgi:microcystin-dependent protein